MIDVAKYVARYRTGDPLLYYLKNNRGGNSEDFAYEIFMGNKDRKNFDKESFSLESKMLNEKCIQIISKLQITPALVSRLISRFTRAL